MDTTMNDQLGRLPDTDVAAEAVYYDRVTSKRLLAWILDSILIMILGTLLIPFTAFAAVFFLPFFFLVIGFAYRVLTMTGGSATLGMRIAGIEFRRADGSRFDFGTAVLHTLLYTVWVGVFPLQLVSIVLMLITPQKQGLHDLILSTAAIRRSV